MSLAPGTRLGPYEVVAQIGAGGMGEVYRATDTNLKRSVAIKVLPEPVATDPERLARFRREAEVLAALNHPNIAHIYGVEKSGSATALVMELVEGPTLADRIVRGAIPVDEALPIAKQIAEALEAAHECGIIHRDLKPANIKVRDDGTVKVLDFGLAKAIEPVGASGATSASASMSPTITTPAMTEMGMILGTASYMSPEQAKGRAVDRRADIWAFGVVSFEMLTGRRAFPGDEITEVIAAVLKTEPDWTALPATVPPNVRRLLRRCLEKDPKKRLRDIAEGMLQLDEPAPGERADGSSASLSRGRAAWLVAGAAVIIAIALAVPAVRHLGEAPAVLAETRTDIAIPEGAGNTFALSPDGRHLVFSAQSNGPSQLWIRSLASTTARPLPGTEGGSRPFWSPDSRSIGFFADALKRIDLDGTDLRTLGPTGRSSSTATWGADDVILLGSPIYGPILRVAVGGERSSVTTVTTLASGEQAHAFPQFLPDGRRFLFTAYGAAETSGIYLASLDGVPPTRLTPSLGLAKYLSAGPGSADHGWLLQVRTEGLVAQPFDVDQATVTGDAVTIAQQVGALSVSLTGLVAYRTGELLATPRRQFSWIDIAGNPIGNIGEPDDFGPFALSPDGKTVAVVVRKFTDKTTSDIGMLDVMRGLRTRFTFANENETHPVWSPDGRQLVFESSRKGHADLYRKSIDGAIGSEELLLADEHDKTPFSWSRDGKYLLYGQPAANRKSDVWVLPMTGDRTPFAFAQTEFSESQPAFSPDGRWVAFVSDESGSADIYAAPFPGPGARRLISAKQAQPGEGGLPSWRADGGAIYYIAPDRTLMMVEVKIRGNELEAGLPQRLFGPIHAVGGHAYEVSADGKRVLTLTYPQDTANAPITLLQNWRPVKK